MTSGIELVTMFGAVILGGFTVHVIRNPDWIGIYQRDLP